MNSRIRLLLALLALVLLLAVLIHHTPRTPQPSAETQTAENNEAAARSSESDLVDRYYAALERATEAALYNQNDMLAEDLGRLKPGDPEHIELFLLAVAGDGSQEVFRREVEFIRDRLDRQFATAGRSLLLVNSHTTTRQLPLATATSIEIALEGLAAIMDHNQDILFLYLTSHGSPEHELVLDHRGVSLPDLPAGQLANIIKRLPIKWKVIVVSACYSGGFIEPLKDPYTLIMTAARHDRQSFGCTDESDMTYFGRAFFEKALAEAGSFVEAFRIASDYVDDWEQEFDEASLPQIHAPEAIVRQLDQWAESNDVFTQQKADRHN